MRLRSSSASCDPCPTVIYHTMITLCIDQTHGANFSTLPRLPCCGASISRTCLLERNSTSIDHRQANCVITQPMLAPMSVVNRYASRIRHDGSRTTTTLTGRRPSTVGHTASYDNAFSDRALPYATTSTACHSHDPTTVRLRPAFAAASFGHGSRGPFVAFRPRLPEGAFGTRGSYNAASPRNRPTKFTRSSRFVNNTLVAYAPSPTKQNRFFGHQASTSLSICRANSGQLGCPCPQRCSRANSGTARMGMAVPGRHTATARTTQLWPLAVATRFWVEATASRNHPSPQTDLPRLCAKVSSTSKVITPENVSRVKMRTPTQ